MTWFRVDDKFWGHPKQTALPPGAVALWVRAGSWSADQLTDGRVPEHMVTMLGAKRRDAEHLVTAGLWVRVEGGYQFHEWTSWQPSREEVHAKRAEEAERKRKWREKRAADKAAADVAVPDMSHWDSRVASAGTDAGVPDMSHSSRPDPTRPDPSSPYGEDEKGGISRTERASQPPRYPDHCSEHANDPVPPRCGGCQKQKALNAAAPRQLQLVPSATRKCLVHAEPDLAHCRGCAADRKAADTA